MDAGTRFRPEESLITKGPYYESMDPEVDLFLSAYKSKIPILLKGSTECGKTYFIEYMAWRSGIHP